MKIDFVLVAEGTIIMPNLNIAIMDGYAEGAKVEAQGHIASLDKAGYTRFTLYDVSGEAHKQIATYRVGHQKPHIIMN